MITYKFTEKEVKEVITQSWNRGLALGLTINIVVLLSLIIFK